MFIHCVVFISPCYFSSIPFLILKSSGKRLRVIRKRIESQFKDECQISTIQPPFSSEQFLYPVVPSLIFEKQRKQVLQRGCFMEEKLYSSNLENAQSLSTYTLGQVKKLFSDISCKALAKRCNISCNICCRINVSFAHPCCSVQNLLHDVASSLKAVKIVAPCRMTLHRLAGA